MAIDADWVSHYFAELSLVEPLATGGQKTVFRASHPRDGLVVLKIIHANQNPESIEREILAVEAINSPRVPAIYEHGTVVSNAGDFVWIREQYITGQTVRDVLSQAALPLDQIIRMARHVLEALVSAEDARIVHRDVKPDNIMRDVLGNFWLLDFGIARHLALTSLTATVNFFGKLTLGYAPPEQMRNNKAFIDSRADLFALGVTMIEAHTRANPFWEPPPATQLEVVRRVEVQTLIFDFGNSSRAKALTQMTSALTQKRRDLRPRSAAEALSWLETVESQ